jgi:hypothetical protein
MMSLKLLVFAVWSAIHPAAPKLQDAPEIAAAIERVVSEDPQPPVFGSREEDAAVMAYWALKESWLRKGVVGDGGRSFGVWQEPAITGKADVLTQARAWVAVLREGARLCPVSPAAPLSGGCVAARKVADRRVKRARALLDTAKAALAAAALAASATTAGTASAAQEPPVAPASSVEAPAPSAAAARPSATPPIAANAALP